MSENVTSLRGNHPGLFVRGEPDESLVTRLEELLRDAKSGHLRAVAIARVTADRSIITGWDGQCDHHDMTAGVAKLFHRFLAETADSGD